MIESSYHCAFCGERIETVVDWSAGRHQQYVEDCQVCCRPNVLNITIERDESGFKIFIDAEPESDLE